MPVAVKMTKKTISEYLQQSFMKEMTIMSQMMHPNIVRLYGIVSEDVPSPWIVLEYMEHGDLKSFLTKNERSVQQMVKYMVDVAMGMHYISERGLVHRDLAARNVLVGANEICKVADFGLLRAIPRDLSVYTASHSIPSPIRWMPPESIIDRAFSAASDVWSFGVLVWEMFNPTKLPFEKYDNMAVVSNVNEGASATHPKRSPLYCGQDNEGLLAQEPQQTTILPAHIYPPLHKNFLLNVVLSIERDVYTFTRCT
ncbi:Ephrin type-A receptor 8 (Fragment) [Geodia barretti]